ncbi:MAG: serine/threonine-protein kinase [Nannocystaceae bacterium]|nr:serine/threonine-protein kinase [Nannocystaceae bacterium]
MSTRDEHTAADASGARSLGRVIGRFVVLDRLGRGGAGVVHLAYDPELDRKVALKLVHVHSDADLARVLREAQSLARLAHPNVVAIHDVGRFADGVYLAMEYVDGGSVGAWLRAQPRTWREILAVFIAAGRGLTAAHQAGLVHRDIKPDNLMLGRDGRVRVVDFGLARAHGASSVDDFDPSRSGEVRTSRVDDVLTGAGELQGTPMYMAPEQYAGGVVDVRTDVYGLSVSLWEALTGERPFAAASLAGLAKAVGAGEVRGSMPRGVPTWLARAVRRGMATNPAARYPDMTAWVAALTPDRGRGRWGVAAVALAAPLAWWVAAPHDAPCAEADATIRAAWDDARRAEVEVAFAGLGGAVAEGSDAVLSMLDGYAAAVGEGLRAACEAPYLERDGAAAPQAGARVACLEQRVRAVDELAQLLTLGDRAVLERATEAVGALPDPATCSDAQRLARDPPLPTDPELVRRVLATRNEAAATRAVLGLAPAENVEAATRALEADARAIDYPPLTAEVVMLRGDAQQLGDVELAAPTLVKALDLAIATDHDTVMFDALTALVSTEAARNRFDGAEAYRALALAMAPRLGDDRRRQVDLAWAIASLEVARSRPDAALPVLADAIALARASPELAFRLPRLLLKQGRAYTLAESLPSAEVALQEAITLLERDRGSSHPSLAPALLLLAQIRHRERRHDDALALSRRARSLLGAVSSHNAAEVAAALNEEGRALSASERPAEAREAYAAGLAIAEDIHGADHLNVAAGLANVAAMDLRLGRPADARAPLQRALEIRIGKLGEVHDVVGKTHDLVGDAALAAGELDAADLAYGRAISVFERLGGSEDRRLVHALLGRSRIAEARDDRARAVAELERAHPLVAERTPRSERGDVAFALARLLPPEDPRITALLDEAAAAYEDLEGDALAELQRWRGARGRGG